MIPIQLPPLEGASSNELAGNYYIEYALCYSHINLKLDIFRKRHCRGREESLSWRWPNLSGYLHVLFPSVRRLRLLPSHWRYSPAKIFSWTDSYVQKLFSCHEMNSVSSYLLPWQSSLLSHGNDLQWQVRKLRWVKTEWLKSATASHCIHFVLYSSKMECRIFFLTWTLMLHELNKFINYR